MTTAAAAIGAQFEISIDGKPCSYRDRKDFAIEAAEQSERTLALRPAACSMTRRLCPQELWRGALIEGRVFWDCARRIVHRRLRHWFRFVYVIALFATRPDEDFTL
jgi:hypothetical protein